MDKRLTKILTRRVQEMLDGKPYWKYTLEPLQDPSAGTTKPLVHRDAARLLAPIFTTTDDYEATQYDLLGMTILFLSAGQPTYEMSIYPDNVEARYV